MPPVTRDDVVAAYELILGRPPESQDAIDNILNNDLPDRSALRTLFMGSLEFLVHFPPPPPPPPEIPGNSGYCQKDLAIFGRFAHYAGPAKPRYLYNFIGGKIRTTLSHQFAGLDETYESLPVPLGNVQAPTVAWIGALKSVLTANDTYRILELGAGYGPWLVSMSRAAWQMGLHRQRLHGIEADPGIFKFLRLHLADNGIDPHLYPLKNAVVGIENGTAYWLPAEDPAAGYDGVPLDADTAAATPGAVSVEMVSVNDMLRREPWWDLVNVTTTGMEEAICRAGMDMLKQRARWVMVSVAGRAAEAALLSAFFAAGWELEHDKPTTFARNPEAGDIASIVTTNAIQVWRNPRLVPTVPWG